MTDTSEGAAASLPHNRGCIRGWSSLKAVLAADLYRYAGRTDSRSFAHHYLFTPGFKYTVLMRTCGYFKLKPLKGLGTYLLLKFLLLRARYKYGIAIPEYTLIGPGFFINRFGGIYVNGDVVIGNNVNYTHGAMLGQLNRGPRAGNPTLGNRVLLASGCKVIGRIELGNDCSVGANAVVTKDVPDSGVVGGVPAKLLSTSGSEGYINRQVPSPLMRRCEGAFTGPVPDDFYQTV